MASKGWTGRSNKLPTDADGNDEFSFDTQSSWAQDGLVDEPVGGVAPAEVVGEAAAEPALGSLPEPPMDEPAAREARARATIAQHAAQEALAELEALEDFEAAALAADTEPAPSLSGEAGAGSGEADWASVPSAPSAAHEAQSQGAPAVQVAANPPDFRMPCALAATLDLAHGPVGIPLTLHNLSAHGAAGSVAAAVGAQTEGWLQFRLDLGAPPLRLPVVVAWVATHDGFPAQTEAPESGAAASEAGSGGASGSASGLPARAIGFSFCEIRPETAATLARWLDERAQGRAGAWPLPVVPTVAADEALVAASAAGPGGVRPAGGRARGGRLLAALAGVAAGVGLTLGAGAFKQAWDTEVVLGGPEVTAMRGAVKDAGAGRAGDKQPAVATEVTSDAAVQASAKAHAPKVHAQATGGIKPGAQAVVQGQKSEGQDQPKAQPSKTARAKAAKPKTARPTAMQVADLTVHSTPDSIELRLPTDGTAGKHRAFWLKNPRRLVVDVPRRRTTLKRESYAVNHALVERLRVGKHAGKVRFVLETTPSASRRVQIEANQGTLAVQVRRSGAGGAGARTNR